jgi:hypothetical protein
VALHQDTLRPLGDRSPSKGALQVVILREAAQHDIDGALKVCGGSFGTHMGEDAELRSLVHELGIRDVEDSDARACSLLHDDPDLIKSLLGALAEDHQRHVGTFNGCVHTDIGERRVAGYHVVTKAGHDTCHTVNPLLPPIGDENPKL